MSRKPTDKPTGRERIALRTKLVAIHGLTVGEASAISNADNRANIVTKMVEICRTFPKT